MSTIASLSMLRTTAPALVRSESHSHPAPDDPADTAHAVALATTGIAVAWLAFFLLAIEQALATRYGEAVQLALTHLR
jgi:hypothetical protein